MALLDVGISREVTNDFWHSHLDADFSASLNFGRNKARTIVSRKREDK